MELQRFVKIAALAVVVLVVGALFFREISELFMLKNENKKIEKNIEELRKQNEEYRREIEAVKNDKKYLEKILREDLGMIKEREKIFRFNEE